MSRPLVVDRHQAHLFPPTLDELVPADHPIRFLADVVAELPLAQLGLVADYETGDVGRPHYPTAVLLVAWLYGYSERCSSSRRLEWACHNLLALRWLLGDQLPDHNTLWRFWSQHRGQLHTLFGEVLQVALNLGAVDFVLHAIDGTKLRADVCTDRVLRPDALAAALAALETAIAAAGPEEPGSALPPALTDALARRAAIAAQLAQLAASGATHLFASDPDARLRKRPEGGFAPAYNAQVVVDGHSRLIVAAEVVLDATDAPALAPLLAQVEATCGQVAVTTVADGGYHDGSALQAVADAGYGVLVARSAEETKATGNPYHAHQFAYDAATDTYTCPAGEALVFQRDSAARHAPERRERVYRGTACASCALKGQCEPRPGPRELVRRPGAEAVAVNRAARGTPEGQALGRRRKAIVERVFAQIKYHGGIQRVRHRGLAKVQAEWAFRCLVYNLAVLRTQGWPVAARP